MRKKSHISLAKYLVDSMGVQDLQEHKKSFYIGSIIPDLKPSFLTKRHTIEDTFETLINEIKALGEPDSEIIIRKYYFGQSTRLIARALKLKENTVDKKVSRGLQKLRQSLGGVL